MVIDGSMAMPSITQQTNNQRKYPRLGKARLTLEGRSFEAVLPQYGLSPESADTKAAQFPGSPVVGMWDAPTCLFSPTLRKGWHAQRLSVLRWQTALGGIAGDGW